MLVNVIDEFCFVLYNNLVSSNLLQKSPFEVQREEQKTVDNHCRCRRRDCPGSYTCRMFQRTFGKRGVFQRRR